MTTKPKARRFRLRLSSEEGETPPPSVAPQRAEPQRPVAHLEHAAAKLVRNDQPGIRQYGVTHG